MPPDPASCRLGVVAGLGGVPDSPPNQARPLVAVLWERFDPVYVLADHRVFDGFP